MSLDIIFYSAKPSNLYYTRIDGSNVLIDDMYEDGEVGSINITHNLNKMAQRISLNEHTTLYDVLWHGDELNDKDIYGEYLSDPIVTGKDFIDYLMKAILYMKENAEALKQFNPENGWGSYEGLLRFTEQCLGYALLYPDSKVGFSR